MKKFSRQTLIDEVQKFSAEQNWMHNIPLPFNVYTIKKRQQVFNTLDDAKQMATKVEELQQAGSKDGLVYEVSKLSSSILDIACGEGKYSVISAANGAQVLGVDIDETRIKKAQFVASALGLDNVKFEECNIYSERFSELGDFDCALCLGLLHRLPDPFNLINVVAAKTKMILFEWIAAPPTLSQDIPWAYHKPGGLYEWHNARGNYEAKEIASKGRAGGGVDRVSYWYPSYGAIEVMCQRAGLNHFIRFSRAPFYPDLSETPENLTRRVMLLASKEECSVMGRQSRSGLKELTKRKEWPRK